MSKFKVVLICLTLSISCFGLNMEEESESQKRMGKMRKFEIV